MNYSSSTRFASSRVERVDGSFDSAADCVINPPTLSTYADEITLSTEEISHDATNCESLFRTGVVATTKEAGAAEDPDDVPYPRKASDWIGEESGAGYAELGALLHSRFYAPRKVAVGYGAWEDPAEIDLNKVQNSVNWRASGTCAAASKGGLWYRIRRRAPWWSITSHLFEQMWSCNRVVSKSTARFKNTYFCNPTRSTYTRIGPNRVAGYTYGYVTFEPGAMTKRGDCASLLHIEVGFKVRRTDNPANRGW